MNASNFDHFVEDFSETIERLYARSSASRWNLSSRKFAAGLFRSYARRFGEGSPSSNASEQTAFLDSLNVEDLALATACREGNGAAWDHFIVAYRPSIEAFARAAVSGLGAAQNIADSIWA